MKILKCDNCKNKFKSENPIPLGTEQNVFGVFTENGKHILCPKCFCGCCLKVVKGEN